LNLDELLTFGKISNPIDVRGQGIRALDKILPIICEDKMFGTVLVAICFSAVGRNANEVAHKIKNAILQIETKKPIFILWIGRRSRNTNEYTIEKGYEILESANIPVFRDPQRCLNAIKKAYDYNFARNKISRFEKVPKVPNRLFTNTEVKKILAKQSNRIISEVESKKILALYEIPVTKEKVGHSSEECAVIAKDIGFPVALKVISPDLPHKSDSGAIQLNIADASEVKEVFERLMKKVKNRSKLVSIEGVLVQEMIFGGPEIILGMKRDPQFGPLIIFGLGGIFVEVYRDVIYKLPPISNQEAHEMIRAIKGNKLLMGVRGKGPYDLVDLEKVIVRFSSLCVENYDEFEEIDINPVIVREAGRGVVAVDALFLRLGSKIMKG
jgi:acyl-CoA synthetase (NDP forming)